MWKLLQAGRQNSGDGLYNAALMYKDSSFHFVDEHSDEEGGGLGSNLRVDVPLAVARLAQGAAVVGNHHCRFFTLKLTDTRRASLDTEAHPVSSTPGKFIATTKQLGGPV